MSKTPWILLALLTAAVAALAAGCGSDEPAPAPPDASDGGADSAPAERQAGAPRDGRSAAAPEGERTPAGAGPRPGAGPAGCTFEAPPGRLGEDTVALELDGPSCEAGTQVARAVALGQPAGANLEVTPEGFHCRPSTLEKGADVTYTCTGRAGEVSFEVVWSAAGR